MLELYYRVDDFENCLDLCKVKSVMKGSVRCQECEYCVKSNLDECYVICKAIHDDLD